MIYNEFMANDEWSDDKKLRKEFAQTIKEMVRLGSECKKLTKKADDIEFTRTYKFSDPFMPPIKCHPNCCLFCDECTDIYYDSQGPYAIVCLKKR